MHCMHDDMLLAFHIELFRERLSDKSIEAYATILKGIMGYGRSLCHHQVHEFSVQWKAGL